MNSYICVIAFRSAELMLEICTPFQGKIHSHDYQTASFHALQQFDSNFLLCFRGGRKKVENLFNISVKPFAKWQRVTLYAFAQSVSILLINQSIFTELESLIIGIARAHGGKLETQLKHIMANEKHMTYTSGKNNLMKKIEWKAKCGNHTYFKRFIGCCAVMETKKKYAKFAYF